MKWLSEKTQPMFKNLRASLFLVYKAISRGNKGTLALTILVITLAFVNITFISSILSGAVDLAYQQAVDNYVSNIVIEPGQDEDYIKKVASLKIRINMIPGVISCSSHYSLGSTITYDVNKDGDDVREISWPVKSIDPEEETKVTNIHDFMVGGRYLDKSDRDQVIMGREVSGGYGAGLEIQSLKGAEVGDEITIHYSNGITRDYEIKGIFVTQLPMADMAVFVTEKEMESVLGLRDRASEILVRTDQRGQEELYIQRLRQIGIVDEEISPWIHYIGLISGITQSFEIIKKIVAFIGLVVAGVTIFIVIFINTVSRRRQIGILKAIGVDEKIIIASYVFQALLYAVVGIGVGLNVTYFVLVPHFISHPLPFPMGMVSLLITRNELTASIVGLLLVSLVGGLVPSWRVARENIIKAIWG